MPSRLTSVDASAFAASSAAVKRINPVAVSSTRMSGFGNEKSLGDCLRQQPSSDNRHTSTSRTADRDVAFFWIRAIMLSFDNVTVRIAGREIISGATANLPAGRRIGLVGRNGAGKSTLLKVILGELAPDGGDVSWPRDWKIGAVAQEAPGGA